MSKRLYGDAIGAQKSRRPSKKARTATQVAKSIVASNPGLVRLGGGYGKYGINAKQAGMAPELKFFDTANGFTFDRTAEVPATGQLVLIPQGDTESTRDGRLAYIKSIQMRGNLTYVPAAGATAATQCTMYLVLDTQANGAAAAVTDVFTSTAVETQLINLNNSGRFRVLKRWDFRFASPAGVSTAYNNVVVPFNFYKRCNIKIDWSSTTGAITEIRSNNLFLIAGSAFDDDTVTYTGVTRVRFQG